jgi:hypothetical protein
MKLRYVRLICVFMVCLAASTGAFAQMYRQLTADDFSGNIPAGSAGMVAYTSCNVTMTYQVSRGYGNSYRLLFDVQLVLNRNKSWMDRRQIVSSAMLNGILRHEQGHYQMAYLMQQEMLRALNQNRYTSDYQYQALATFNRVKDKYKQLNLDYDADTNHMLNTKQQAVWENWLNREVSQWGRLAMN